MVVYTTITLALRIIRTGRPEPLAEMFVAKAVPCTAKDAIEVPRCSLNISLEGFHNQATRLLNTLPGDLKEEQNKLRLKRNLKQWIMDNIHIKPT